MSISDSDKTAKKAVETTPSETTSNLGTERDRLTQAEETDAKEPEPSTGRADVPPSGPKFPTPLPPPFAITSNGKILLNVDACPGLNLDGRPIFRGIELSEPEAAYAFRKIENTIHDAAGHLGGMLKRRETEGSGGDDNT